MTILLSNDLIFVSTTKGNNMKNSINTNLLSDNNIFTFKNVPSMSNGFTDVYYQGKRIAILNGLSSPLQWTAKNGSNIPINIIEKLESMVVRLIKKSN